MGLVGGLCLVVLSVACGRVIVTAPGPAVGTVEVSLALHLVLTAAVGVVSLWLAVLLLLGAASAAPGRLLVPVRAGARRLAPRLAPRLAAALVTASVSLVPLTAAHSTGASGTAAVRVLSEPAVERADDTSSQSAPAPTPEPGWAPTPPTPRQDPDSVGLVSRGGAGPDSVVVRAGDTLWDVAARHLGPTADASQIADAWPRWHEANREAIGPDPDLILPGTELVPPPIETQAGADR